MLKNFLHPNTIEAGCDEAGRGCLAGPVCAAAVIMPINYSNPLLNDSKKMNSRNRIVLREEIEREAISFAVAFVDNEIIDKVNILRASILAMHKALGKLKVNPEHILVDGNRFITFQEIPHSCIIKGDGKYVSIAAASVLAKTYRDEYMLMLHKKHKEYAWDQNKGYPTKNHRQAISMHGPVEYHRRSFRLLNTQRKIDFNI